MICGLIKVDFGIYFETLSRTTCLAQFAHLYFILSLSLQPLNEDKYLCFSCNNWLINWHSLQALNSNDAESPSGTFRSHLNSGNVLQDEKSSGSKKQIAVCRPIARVSPQQSQAVVETQQEAIASSPVDDTAAEEEAMSNQSVAEDSKPSHKINFNKRNFRLQLGRKGRLQHKSMQLCACGKCIVVRSTSNKLSKNKNSSSQPKCRKCRELSRMKASYMRSIVQVERELAIREAPLQYTSRNLVYAGATATQNQSSTSQTQAQKEQQQQQQRLHLPKPTVDGKVVAMLRRLGTHLSRESHNGNGSNVNTTERLPQIMSPTKPAPSKWLRPLEDDEVLLNFDSSISEVLPSLADQFTQVNFTAARRSLTFQVSETAEVIDLCEEDDDDADAEEMQLDDNDEDNEDFAFHFKLPKGLSITLA